MNRIIKEIDVYGVKLTITYRENPKYWKFKIPIKEFNTLLNVKDIEKHISPNEKNKFRCYGACSDKSFGFEYIDDLSKVTSCPLLPELQAVMIEVFENEGVPLIGVINESRLTNTTDKKQIMDDDWKYSQPSILNGILTFENQEIKRNIDAGISSLSSERLFIDISLHVNKCSKVKDNKIIHRNILTEQLLTPRCQVSTNYNKRILYRVLYSLIKTQSRLTLYEIYHKYCMIRSLLFELRDIDIKNTG